MPFSPMSSGAWLSGSPQMGAGWQPIQPPGGRYSSDWQPKPPPGDGTAAGWQPVQPPSSHNSAVWQPKPPPTGHSADWQPKPPPWGPDAAFVPRTHAPWPWDSVDPAWTFQDANALLAQALRKTRAKIARPADARLAASGGAAVGPVAAAANALWRWQPSFRVTTVVSELLGRFVMADKRLYVVTGTVSGASAPLVAQSVFEIGTPPPGFDHAGQLDKVMRAAVEREDRLPEILSQADDLSPFFDSICGFNLLQAPAAAELMAAAQDLALHVCMALKHQVAADRPWQASSLVVPVIATPGHGSLPSGHATVAAMTSELLTCLLYKSSPTHPRSEQLDRLARRIAFNRVVAGLHFPIDSYVGYQLGTQLARLLAAAAGKGKAPKAVDSATVFGAIELLESGTRPLFVAGPARLKMPEAPCWKELWRVAADQLAQLRV